MASTNRTQPNFDDFFTKRKQGSGSTLQLDEPTTLPPVDVKTETGAPALPGRRGRPASSTAKSTDPDFRAWTGYLRKDTLAEAEYRLKRAEDPRGMSGLLQDLLQEWVGRQ